MNWWIMNTPFVYFVFLVLMLIPPDCNYYVCTLIFVWTDMLVCAEAKLIWISKCYMKILRYSDRLIHNVETLQYFATK